MRTCSRLGLEQLEDREVPAGVVTVTGANVADVLITGDNLDNDITVTMTPNGVTIQANGTTTLSLGTIPTSWTVINNTTTTISLLLPTTNSTVDNLSVNMQKGKDSVGIFGSGPSLVAVNNNIVVGPGDDDDRVNVAAIAVGGMLAIRETTGNDTVVIDNVDIGGNTYIYLTSGDDRAFITSSKFNGDLIIAAAGGNDVVRFIPGTVTVGNNLGIYTGGGNDRVFVDPGTSGAATLDVAGNTAIYTHGGDDFIRFGSPTTGGASVSLHATVINTGAGNDRLYMRDAIMSLLIALMDTGDDTVLNNWGTDNVNVGFGSLLDGGPHMMGDSLPTPWSAPAGLTVINFP